MTPWQRLGIERDAAVADVRRRYAALIKEFRPESHPEEFARIREAYEIALAAARRREAERTAAIEAGEAVQRAGAPETARPAEPGAALPGNPAPARPAAPVVAREAKRNTESVPGGRPAMCVDTAPPAEVVRLRAPAPPPEADPAPVGPDPAPVRIDATPPATARPPLPPAPPPIRIAIDAPAPAPAALPTAPPVRVHAKPDAPAQAPPAAPDLEQQFRALRTLAQQLGEQATLPALRRLLKQSMRAAIDERQALEFALLRWFLETGSPPLLLMFDAGRAFDWHRQEDRLSPWVPADACRRLALLLTMSRDAVFAQHFAGNHWLRRLFTPGMWLPRLGSTITLAEARAWDARWRAHCAAAGPAAAALGRRADATARRRIEGALVLSTDVLVGMLIAGLFAVALANELRLAFPRPGLRATPDWVFGVALAIGAGIALAALRRLGGFAARTLHEAPRLARLRTAIAWSRQNASVAIILVAGLLAAIGIFAASESEPAFIVLVDVVVGLIGALVGAVMLRLAWYLAVIGERCACGMLAWREAADRWEFARVLARPPEVLADTDSSGSHRHLFGERATTWQRLRAFREAQALEAGETARRERPPRVSPLPRFGRKKTAGGARAGFSPWWILWIAIAAVRLVALIGH